jgi:hypothetical protein
LVTAAAAAAASDVAEGCGRFQASLSLSLPVVVAHVVAHVVVFFLEDFLFFFLVPPAGDEDTLDGDEDPPGGVCE